MWRVDQLSQKSVGTYELNYDNLLLCVVICALVRRCSRERPIMHILSRSKFDFPLIVALVPRTEEGGGAQWHPEYGRYLDTLAHIYSIINKAVLSHDGRRPWNGRTAAFPWRRSPRPATRVASPSVATLLYYSNRNTSLALLHDCNTCLWCNFITSGTLFDHRILIYLTHVEH